MKLRLWILHKHPEAPVQDSSLSAVLWNIFQGTHSGALD